MQELGSGDVCGVFFLYPVNQKANTAVDPEFDLFPVGSDYIVVSSKYESTGSETIYNILLHTWPIFV